MKKNKLPSLIVLMILTLITTMFWIMFSIYRVFVTKTDIVVPTEFVTQIDTHLDLEVINSMKNRQ
jgi:hypothetical protein